MLRNDSPIETATRYVSCRQQDEIHEILEFLFIFFLWNFLPNNKISLDHHMDNAKTVGTELYHRRIRVIYHSIDNVSGTMVRHCTNSTEDVRVRTDVRLPKVWLMDDSRRLGWNIHDGCCQLASGNHQACDVWIEIKPAAASKE